MLSVAGLTSHEQTMRCGRRFASCEKREVGVGGEDEGGARL
jgi:hypothetical protein